MRKSCVKHLSNELFILCLWRSCLISRKRLYLPKIKHKVSNIQTYFFFVLETICIHIFYAMNTIYLDVNPTSSLIIFCIYLTYIIFVTIQIVLHTSNKY